MKQSTKSPGAPDNHSITAEKALLSRLPPLEKLPEQYLMGQWPREPDALQHTCMTDKATQTPGFWVEEGDETLQCRSASWGSAERLQEISKLRQQLQRSLQGFSLKEKEEVKQQINQKFSSPSSSSVPSRPAMCRLPSDCVNQELESVFICQNWNREEEKALEVRDGGRAPVPPLHHSPCFRSSSSADRGFSSPHPSGSPLPQFSSSPKPNNSFTFKREPPEGCEKVKVFEDIISCRTQGFPVVSCPDRNKVNFTPSGSAFCPVNLLCSSLFPPEPAAAAEFCCIRKRLLLR